MVRPGSLRLSQVMLGGAVWGMDFMARFLTGGNYGSSFRIKEVNS